MASETPSQWPTRCMRRRPFSERCWRRGGKPKVRIKLVERVFFKKWYLGYYPDQARSRLDLLLDHGADVNSAMPEDGSDSSGYPLLLYRTKMGLDDKLAYADALALLERGADPNRAGAEGMTFGKM